jgi:Tol biopolymer transport system component
MKKMKHLCRILWAVTVLGICSAVVACLPTLKTEVPSVAATPLSSTPPTAAILKPTATASSTSTSTALPMSPTTVSPTSPPAIDTPQLTPRSTETATLVPFEPCGQLITYESQNHRTHSVTVVDECSQQTMFLTDHKGHDQIPKWSPDGEYIAFLSTRGRTQDWEYRDIWLLDVNALELSQITVGENIWPHDWSFIWSPDGSEILYSSARGEENTTWIVGLRDGDTRFLPELWEPFDWSPDGSKIALVASVKLRDEPPKGYEDAIVTPSQLVAVQPDGDLIAGGDVEWPYTLHNSHEWRWSPDSQHLAVAFYNSLRGMGGDLELVAIENREFAVIARLQDLLPSVEEKAVQSLSWSPDGEAIAFVVVEPSRLDRPYWGQVHVVDRDFTHVRTLTPEDMFCDGVQWSPDGSQLTFACDDGEPYASIWLVNADGSDLHAITEPAEDVRGPQWQPVPHP